jgi:hypothetical protein
MRGCRYLLAPSHPPMSFIIFFIVLGVEALSSFLEEMCYSQIILAR